MIMPMDDHGTAGKDANPMAPPVTLRIELAGRTVGRIRRRLRTLSLTLSDVLGEAVPALPPPGADGYLLRSFPAAAIPALYDKLPGWLLFARQYYPRHHVVMVDGDFDRWWQGFSARTRSTLSRKARRLADRFDGGFTIEAYRTPDEVRHFMTAAQPLARRTYQARLLGAGLPTDEAAVIRAIAAAEEDALRCFLLVADGRAIAYLYLPVRDDVLIYAHLGYDPDFADLSPGTVLHVEAMRRLYAERRFRAFDFTEGDGAHKAQFGRAAVPCADVIAMRATLRNRLALAALRGADGFARRAKMLAARAGIVASLRKWVRR